MSSMKVLSVGNNPELLWLRDAVLRSAGFDVITSLNLQDGLARIEGEDCGVLLLCYSRRSSRANGWPTASERTALKVGLSRS